LRSDDDVIKIPYAFARCAGIPVVLKEDRVDAIVLPSANPIKIASRRFEMIVDPELKDAIRETRGVQPDVGLDAIPLVGCYGRENRGSAGSIAKPAKIAEVIVLSSCEIAVGVYAASRIHEQKIATAPNMGDHGLSPIRIGKNCRTRQLVRASCPARLHSEIESPVYFAKVYGRMAL